MSYQEEQRGASDVDPELVEQVLSLTRDVNANLGSMIRHTNRLIWRQNILIGMCLVLMLVLVLVLSSVYSSQRSQEMTMRQMEIIQYHMSDIGVARDVIGQELLQIKESMRQVNDQRDKK